MYSYLLISGVVEEKVLQKKVHEQQWQLQLWEVKGIFTESWAYEKCVIVLCSVYTQYFISASFAWIMASIVCQVRIILNSSYLANEKLWFQFQPHPIPSHGNPS